MAVDLGAGTYAFRCVMEDTDVVVGPTITVPGDAKAAVPPVLPVSQLDMIGPTKRYYDYVALRCPGCVPSSWRCATRSRATTSPGRGATGCAAHLAYERLGAAYGAFGDADGEINGRPTGSARRRPRQAVHRLPPRRVRPLARRGRDGTRAAGHGVAARGRRPRHELRDSSRSIRPRSAIRAHEITENAVQFELTGETDFGSHSILRRRRRISTERARCSRCSTPLLAKRYPALPELNCDAGIARSADLDASTAGPLDAAGGPDHRARERIDADFSELTELLAPVASICEPRRTS